MQLHAVCVAGRYCVCQTHQSKQCGLLRGAPAQAQDGSQEAPAEQEQAAIHAASHRESSTDSSTGFGSMGTAENDVRKVFYCLMTSRTESKHAVPSYQVKYWSPERQLPGWGSLPSRPLRDAGGGWDHAHGHDPGPGRPKAIPDFQHPVSATGWSRQSG
eukprot:3627318-Amphidinium_carterae.2